MKPFSIKEHLEHPDWKVVTRDGKPVRILCTDLADDNYPVVAIINKWHVDKFTADGIFQAGEETKYDLFFVLNKYKGWVNLFENPNPYETCKPIIAGHSLYETKDEAEKIGNLSDGYVVTAKIEWEQ